MSIISRIKSWFEPEVKVATTKAKVRFKNGAAINLYTPDHAGDEMRTKACGFVSVNRDLEREKLMRDRLMNAHPLHQIRMQNYQRASWNQIGLN